MRNPFVIALSLPKTLYVNLKCFGLKGLKLPVIVHYKTRVEEIHKGNIVFTGPLRFKTVNFGFGGSKSIIPNSYNILFLAEGSQMIFGGKASFSEGFSIQNKGEIKIADDFFANKNLRLFIEGKLFIGKGCKLGYDCEIRDMNGHRIIYKDGTEKSVHEVSVGDYVWIASNSVVMNGTKIGENSVVAMGSITNKDYSTAEGVIIGGIPATIIKENISWEEDSDSSKR